MPMRYPKRLFDIIGALVALALFAIPIVIIYIFIRLEDHGPAIYCQERIGYKGRPFMLYKFRSMSENAEDDGNPRLCESDDDRLTRTGRFIRSHHLDEFPQLWNILRGDMSFVGPRPERKFFIDKIVERDPRYTKLYALRPGIFSMATLKNGYTDTIDKMLCRMEMDLDYLEHRSMATDLRIIGMTTWAIVSGKQF